MSINSDSWIELTTCLLSSSGDDSSGDDSSDNGSSDNGSSDNGSSGG